MTAELIVLRVIHIMGGIFWVGSGMFVAFFLMPVLSRSGPAAAQVMMGLQHRKLFTFLPVAAVLTILSGARLMMIASNSFSGSYFALASGKAYAISGALAIVAFVVGLAVSRPGAARMNQLQNMAVSDEVNRTRILEEIAALQKRVALSSSAAVILIVLSSIGMAIARYL